MENEETASGTAQSTESEETATDAYETTEEEMEGYYIVRAVLSREVDPKRITYKDTQNYFAIILDGKVTRTICRLRFNYQAIRRVSFINDDKTEDNIDLKDISGSWVRTPPGSQKCKTLEIRGLHTVASLFLYALCGCVVSILHQKHVILWRYKRRCNYK